MVDDTYSPITLEQAQQDPDIMRQACERFILMINEVAEDKLLPRNNNQKMMQMYLQETEQKHDLLGVNFDDPAGKRRAQFFWDCLNHPKAKKNLFDEFGLPNNRSFYDYMTSHYANEWAKCAEAKAEYARGNKEAAAEIFDAKRIDYFLLSGITYFGADHRDEMQLPSMWQERGVDMDLIDETYIAGRFVKRAEQMLSMTGARLLLDAIDRGDVGYEEVIRNARTLNQALSSEVGLGKSTNKQVSQFTTPPLRFDPGISVDTPDGPRKPLAEMALTSKTGHSLVPILLDNHVFAAPHIGHFETLFNARANDQTLDAWLEHFPEHLNDVNSSGKTMLDMALHYKSPDMAQYLLSRGADITATRRLFLDMIINESDSNIQSGMVRAFAQFGHLRLIPQLERTNEYAINIECPERARHSHGALGTLELVNAADLYQAHTNLQFETLNQVEKLSNTAGNKTLRRQALAAITTQTVNIAYASNELDAFCDPAIWGDDIEHLYTLTLSTPPNVQKAIYETGVFDAYEKQLATPTGHTVSGPFELGDTIEKDKGGKQHE